MDGEIKPVYEEEAYGIEPVDFWFEKEFNIFGFQFHIKIWR